MIDHAQVIREALNAGVCRGTGLDVTDDPFAALAALVDERDEYLQMVFADMASEKKERRSYNAQGIRMRCEKAIARAEAAEAERDRLKAALEQIAGIKDPTLNYVAEHYEDLTTAAPSGTNNRPEGRKKKETVAERRRND